MTSLDEARARLRNFNAARDWGRFHTPKNLVLALTGEVGELAAAFQWLAEDDVADWLAKDENASSVRQEIADVLAYLLLLADAVDVDPVLALMEKLELNETRYPVEQARGNARKYDQL